MTTRQISYRLKSDGRAELQRDAKAVGDALQDAGDRGSAAFERTGRALQNTGELSERQIAKYRALAQAAREAEKAEEAQARYNAALGVGRGTGLRPSDFLSADEVGGTGLTRRQRAGRLNLARQGGDIFTTAAMGMSPAMIAIQQGPQIIEAIAEAGIKATPAMLALGGAATVVAGSMVALTVAGLQYEQQQKKVDVATQGLGRTLQMTSAQFDQYAQAGAEMGGVSVKAATDIGVAYVQTGQIGGKVLGDLIALTKRYSLTTNQSVEEATKDLAKHFSTGSKGVEELNDRLHFLNATELEHIKNLADSGRQTEAQQLVIERLRGALLDADSATSGWDQTLAKLGDTASDVWRKVGHAIAVAMGGGSDQEKLQELLVKRSQAQLEKRSTLLYLGKPIEDYDREIAEVQARIAKAAQTAARTALNDRDTQRAAIVKKNQDPKIQQLQDKENELTKYLGLGGVRGDDTAKTLQADIDALKAGYSSAEDRAKKLEQAHDKAVRAGEKAAREKAAEARKDAREAEEAIRLEGLRADHVNDNALRIARASGDQSTIDNLERQQRLQEDINRWVREGLSLEQARVNARAQMANEMQAESDALRKARSNPEGFVSSQDALAKALSGSNIRPFRALDEYAEQLRVSTGDAFHDGLVAGMTGGSFFEIFADRLRYAAASALADSLTTSLFGSRSGNGKVGLIQTALRFIPGFAGGVSASTGGRTLVGEYGPEIVDLPAGSAVHTAAATRAMVQNLAGRAANAGSGEVVNFHYSPTYHLQGTSEEIRALRGEIAKDRANFRANAVQAYADAKARRVI